MGVPKILKHSSNNRETPYPYSILEPTRGTPISMLSPPLSLASRRSVDKQVGSFARALASRKSPCGTFGMANRVLPDPSSNTLSSTAPKLGTVKEIKSTQLPRLYILKMTDGRPLLLSITPRLSVRLLRHEATIMASEASIIYFLAESSTSRRLTSPASSRASPRSDDGDSRSEEMELEGLVPKILKHSSNNRETPYPYSILEPTRGT